MEYNRTLTNNKKASNIDIPINNNNDESSINPINTANAFNTYFTSVADTLLNKNFFEMDTNNNDDPMTYLRQNFKCCQSQIKLKNTTTRD